MKNVELAPWERDYLRQKRGVTRTMFSISQWAAKGKRVVVGNQEARRVIVTSTGHRLHLFSEDQTEQL